jgi:hypothetical protein
MIATITYRMDYVPHPWDAKRRKEGTKAWCLMKVVTAESGQTADYEAVAIFNFDSEAELFQGHVVLEHLDGKLLTVDRSIAELIELRTRVRR